MTNIFITIGIFFLTIIILILSNKKNSNKNNGKSYEGKCAEYYKKENYKIIKNGKKGIFDKGIDLIAENKEQIILIQCKNYIKSKLSAKDIVTIYGYFQSYKFNKYNSSNKNIIYKIAIPQEDRISINAKKEINIFRNKGNVDINLIII